MTEPKWLKPEAVLLMHAEQLAEHGGAAGLRDRGLLESAVARPCQAFGYGVTDLCELAALYASALVRNHPFVDGNKRSGFLAAYAFLDVNGLELVADEVDVVGMTLGLAAGEVAEGAFADWLRANARARGG